ncbi:MAG: hypothetical protein WD267_12805 [Balneolales bacterium]
MFNKDDEIWDEFQWEVHLKEMEQRNVQMRGIFTSDIRDDKPNWLRLLKEYHSKLDVMNAYIEEELLIEESYFPDDEDWEDEDDDDSDPFFSLLDEESEEDWSSLFEEAEDEDDFEFSDDDDDDDEGEEWKKLSDEFTLSDFGVIENLNVYLEAKSYGADLLKHAETDPEYINNKKFTEFISSSLSISAKLAAGYSYGFGIDVLGANIVYCKKALNFANASLDNLHNLKKTKLLKPARYIEIHHQLFELRNDIGIYIQNLRERFYSLL